MWNLGFKSKERRWGSLIVRHRSQVCKKWHPPHHASTMPCECLVWWVLHNVWYRYPVCGGYLVLWMSGVVNVLFYMRCTGCLCSGGLCGGCCTIENSCSQIQMWTQKASTTIYFVPGRHGPPEQGEDKVWGGEQAEHLLPIVKLAMIIMRVVLVLCELSTQYGDGIRNEPKYLWPIWYLITLRWTLTPASSPSPITGQNRRYRGASRHLPLPCSEPYHSLPTCFAPFHTALAFRPSLTVCPAPVPAFSPHPFARVRVFSLFLLFCPFLLDNVTAWLVVPNCPIT